MDIYTNSRDRHNHMLNALALLADPPVAVSAAVAFFTDSNPVKAWSDRGCFPIRLVVRLGFPTNPTALDDVLRLQGVQVRFFTGSLYHPKLYVFDGRSAIVGSSNLTKAALWDNREVNVGIPSSVPEFADLVATFEEYWQAARPLEPRDLDAYRLVWARYRDRMSWEDQMYVDICKHVGKHELDEVRVGEPTANKDVIELGAYRKQYQEVLTAYQLVRRLYGDRRHPQMAGSPVPVRIEIDQFLSFVREGSGRGSAWADQPFRSGADLEASVERNLAEWFAADWPYLEDLQHGDRSWSVIQAVLGSRSSIAAASYDQILAALSCAHSFTERKRYFKGGHAAHLEAFRKANKDLDKVKKTLEFLVHGKEPFVDRMGMCIYDPRHRLPELGRSAVQEVFGWVNREDAPICNSRTLKALRYLGFMVDVVGED
ncbi:MAG: hypothetical protein HY902_21010 [Deltaproteobacteria bacterium]|nr:hypothetical protein [Deltaproteobacteria bacterium]